MPTDPPPPRCSQEAIREYFTNNYHTLPGCDFQVPYLARLLADSFDADVTHPCRSQQAAVSTRSLRRLRPVS